MFCIIMFLFFFTRLIYISNILCLMDTFGLQIKTVWICIVLLDYNML